MQPSHLFSSPMLYTSSLLLFCPCSLPTIAQCPRSCFRLTIFLRVPASETGHISAKEDFRVALPGGLFIEEKAGHGQTPGAPTALGLHPPTSRD